MPHSQVAAGQCFTTIFKKEWAPYTVPLYAAFEGLALGGISFIYASMYTDIVQQAIFLTVGIFSALLFAYKTKIIKVTENSVTINELNINPPSPIPKAFSKAIKLN